MKMFDYMVKGYRCKRAIWPARLRQAALLNGPTQLFRDRNSFRVRLHAVGIPPHGLRNGQPVTISAAHIQQAGARPWRPPMTTATTQGVTH
ncbi:MAG TPA: hypothetical protein PKE26_09465 [Kiritimatiellia bacterium]|nr:hypothetical protein [Kiritimatiellia bacterium]HMO99323.1 hypothetical protein [Kiritimatiellia bacterium]HMP96081.1 hypothetical protein [Kiritimatiellia bacterium]